MSPDYLTQEEQGSKTLLLEQTGDVELISGRDALGIPSLPYFVGVKPSEEKKERHQRTKSWMDEEGEH